MNPMWSLAPMTPVHLSAVLAIERTSFRTPWPEEAFEASMESAAAPHARARVLLDADDPAEVRGFICYWILEGELSIHEIAVRAEDRRRGGARFMLESAFSEAAARGCAWAFLEVRPSNAAALRLYESLGFEPAGRRPHYYEDTGEDALVLRAPVRRARTASRPVRYS